MVVKKAFYEDSCGMEFVYYPKYAEVLPLSLEAEDFFLSKRTEKEIYFPSRRKAKKFLYDVCRVRLAKW